MSPLRWTSLATVCGLLATPGEPGPGLHAADGAGQIEVSLKDHRFTRSEIHFSARKKIELLIKNEDATADEFELLPAFGPKRLSEAARRGVVRLRALDPGRYPFEGEFNAATAQGVVVAE